MIAAIVAFAFILLIFGITLHISSRK